MNFPTEPVTPENEPRDFTRPDLIAAGKGRLGFWERTNLRLIARTFEPGPFNRFLALCQRTVGQAWIHHSTKHLRTVLGAERLPSLSDEESLLVVANHRSFFDLYVITAGLVRAGLTKRIIFPVRSGFFYDNPFGIVVNFLMSFLSMYPPIFRDRKKAALNLASLDELSFLLKRGGVFAGLHPEGTRSRGADPYEMLAAQPGVGRVIHKSQVRVVPAFVSGLTNDLGAQLKGNFTRRGAPIAIVFGEPIDFDDLLDQKGSPRVYRQIAERCLERIAALHPQEQAFRAKLKV